MKKRTLLIIIFGLACGVLAARILRSGITEALVPTAPEVIAAKQGFENPVAPRSSAVAKVEKEASPGLTPEYGHDVDVNSKLATLERLRGIPGAAPLIDEIVTYLKSDRGDLVSLDNITADENGLALLDDDALAEMIPDEKIRVAMTKLTELMAKHPEALESE